MCYGYLPIVVCDGRGDNAPFACVCAGSVEHVGIPRRQGHPRANTRRKEGALCLSVCLIRAP
jgi:hypothetical protein